MPAVPVHHGRSSPWRRAVVWVLLLAGCLGAALALVAVWADALVLDQDRYVDAIGPLAGDAAVQDAVTTVLTDAIAAQVDPPIGAGATRAVIEEAVETVVSSGAFRTLWTDANRFAHAQVVAVLTGKDSDILQTRDGEIYLELGPLVAAGTDGLSLLGVDLSAISAAAPDIEFPILTFEDFTPAQRWVRRLEQAAVWLPLVAIAALAAALWISPSRWRTAGRIGLGLLGSGLLVLLAAAAARILYRTRIPDDVPGAVAERLFDRLVDPLQVAAFSLCAVAVVMALTGFVAPRFRRMSRYYDRQS